MKIKKVTIELIRMNPIDRRMRFCIEDEDGQLWKHEEMLWESDAIDVVSTIFNSALRHFHEEMNNKETEYKIYNPYSPYK